MRTFFPTRRQIVGLLLFVALLMICLSVLFFLRLDYIVHNDLYRYGLQYSDEWASQYWNYSRLILGLLGVSILVSCASIAFTVLKVRFHKANSISVFVRILSLIRIAMCGLSAYFLTRLDNVVHGDLYTYGLQFSYEWAGQYWNYLWLILYFLGLGIAVSAFPFLQIAISRSLSIKWPLPKNRTLNINLRTRAKPLLIFSSVVVMIVLIIATFTMFAQRPRAHHDSLNLLLNPSVENDNDNNGEPDYWLLKVADISTDQLVWSTDAHTGNRSLEIHITRNDALSQYAFTGWRQKFDLEKPTDKSDYSPLERGKSYGLRGWGKTQGAELRICVIIWDSNYSVLFAEGVGVNSPTWTQSQWVDFTVPEEARFVAISAVIMQKNISAGFSTAWARADDFELVSVA